ncbi:MAG TPA: exosortase F system-associated protein [Flavobacterium sp.]|nr:exosortase F system-associated protein [Flavobacterium sp.]
MPNKTQRYVGVFVAIVAIVLVRFFESKLFYDPFLQFFKIDYQNKPLPNIDVLKLTVHLFFRFSLNTFFSLAIIYFLFLNKMFVKIAFTLFVIVFVVMISSIWFLLLYNEEPNYLYLFYTRRFLIQPILVLLLIPAFYFQNLTTS